MASDDQMEQFILEVEANTVLYNLADKSYKDIKLKFDIWEEIAAKVGIESGLIASKKFTNIKDAYVAYLKKIRQISRSGQGLGGKLRKYKWADQLQFLNAYVTTRRSTGNLPMTDNDESECETILNCIIAGEGHVDEEESNTSAEEQKVTTAEAPNHMLPKKRRVKNEDVNAVIIDYLSAKKVVEKDALCLFFESALKTVRTFPKSKQIEMRKIISNALFEIEESLTNNEQ